MERFTLYPNHFLKRQVNAFYNRPYVGYQQPGNPDFLNTLKNQFRNKDTKTLEQAAQEVRAVLAEDLPAIPKILGLETMTVCVVPRAKREKFYREDQRLFRKAVQQVVSTCPVLLDGTFYIQRHTNTRTTHIRRRRDTDGDSPYPGITRATCHLSERIRGQNILLVDDIYTAGVNVDEDAIQALYDVGARSVTLYVVARTMRRGVEWVKVELIG
jgi:hypothetical protein